MLKGWEETRCVWVCVFVCVCLSAEKYGCVCLCRKLTNWLFLVAVRAIQKNRKLSSRTWSKKTWGGIQADNPGKGNGIQLSKCKRFWDGSMGVKGVRDGLKVFFSNQGPLLLLVRVAGAETGRNFSWRLNFELKTFPNTYQGEFHLWNYAEIIKI